MSDFINKKTFQIRKSVHDPDMKDESDWVVCNDMEIPDCDIKYWVWNEEENRVGEMTQEEKTAVDQAEVDTITQAEENAKDINNMEKLTKALALVILDEINVLRTKVGLQERTVAQLKTAVKAKYDTL